MSARIGLPKEQEERVARTTYAPFAVEELTAGMIEATGLDADTVAAWIGTLFPPDSAAARAAALGGAFDPTSDFLNGYAYVAAEFPAANMVTDARSLARMYAATVIDQLVSHLTASFCKPSNS